MVFDITNTNTYNMEDKISIPLKYVTIPCSLLGSIKPRMLYLLTALYSTCHYDNNFMYTDVTIDQLSLISGESKYYIRDFFFPYLRQMETPILEDDDFHYLCSNRTVKRRNLFTLLRPTENFRIISSEILLDRSLTPDEKGYIIALYILCVNNTFRFDLNDKLLATKIGVSLNTWKKYKELLLEKGIILPYINAPEALLDVDHIDSSVLMYPHLGATTAQDLIELGQEKELTEEIRDAKEWLIRTDLFKKAS